MPILTKDGKVLTRDGHIILAGDPPDPSCCNCDIPPPGNCSHCLADLPEDVAIVLGGQLTKLDLWDVARWWWYHDGREGGFYTRGCCNPFDPDWLAGEFIATPAENGPGCSRAFSDSRRSPCCDPYTAAEYSGCYQDASFSAGVAIEFSVGNLDGSPPAVYSPWVRLWVNGGCRIPGAPFAGNPAPPAIGMYGFIFQAHASFGGQLALPADCQNFDIDLPLIQESSSVWSGYGYNPIIYNPGIFALSAITVHVRTPA